MGNMNEEQNLSEIVEDVVVEAEISDEVASQIESQLSEKKEPVLLEEPVVVEPVVEPIAEQEAVTHELHPFVTSWKEQLHAMNAIQDQWEQWSLDMLEQQAAFSQILLPQHELFAPAYEAVKSTQEQVKSSTRSFFAQSQQARSEWLDRAETSALQFQKMGQLFCPYK